MSRVKICTTRACPYCRAAKHLLSSLGINFEEVHLDQDPELRQRLSADNNGWRTVPMIFIDERLIGGYHELQELARSGQLGVQLQQAESA